MISCNNSLDVESKPTKGLSNTSNFVFFATTLAPTVLVYLHRSKATSIGYSRDDPILIDEPTRKNLRLLFFQTIVRPLENRQLHCCHNVVGSKNEWMTNNGNHVAEE